MAKKRKPPTATALWAPKCQRLGNSLAGSIVARLFYHVNPRMKGLSNDRARGRALGDSLPPGIHAVKGGACAACLDP